MIAKRAFLLRAAGGIAGVCCLVALTGAASIAADRSVSTNVPGIRAFPAPLPSFDPLTASQQALAEAGLPRRPDANINPQGYVHWRRAVTAPSTRIIPEIEVTNIYNLPRRVVGVAPSGPSESTNWSGYIVQNKVKTYSKASFGLVDGEFVVPWAFQPFKTCGGPVYASEWVGIDGNGKDTALIQAGVADTNTCKGGTQSLSYVTWFEWFPLSQMNIKNFPTSPGDDYYVGVEALSAAKAMAYIVNYVANVSASITFTAPKGSTLIGNTAEWILEAPTVNGGQTALANYSVDYFAWDEAETFNGGYSYPGEPASGVQSIDSVMINKAGKVISTPELTGPASIYFYNQGTSR